MVFAAQGFGNFFLIVLSGVCEGNSGSIEVEVGLCLLFWSPGNKKPFFLVPHNSCSGRTC